MTWYKSTFLKFANPKSKIQKYKIDDPALKLFIYKYESIVPWESIKTSDDLNVYIDKALNADLHSRILPSSENNQYLTKEGLDIEEEFRNHPNDPMVQAAHRIYQNDPERATDLLLRVVNDSKMKVFNEWWKHLTESENYKSSPSFVYSVFKPVIDSSPSDTKASPPTLNPKALEGVWKEVTEQGATSINVLNRYSKISSELDLSTSKSVKSSTGAGSWIHLPSKTNDPNNYNDNLNKLIRFSLPNRWCTGSGMGPTYLGQGDFWLYVIDGRAVAAIRMIGSKQVAEIQGRNNDISLLKPYWQEVISFLHSTDFDYQRDPHYKELESIMMMNSDLEEGDGERLQYLINAIKNDPDKNYKLISEKNKKRFPILIDTAVEAYNNIVKIKVERVKGAKARNLHHTGERDLFLEYYREIPPEIRDRIDPVVQEDIVNIYRDVINKNPYLLNSFPEIKKFISEKEQIESWIRYIDEDPYRYRDPNIPPEIKKHISKDIISEKWMDLISRNIIHFDYIPKDILPLLDLNRLKDIVIQDFQRYPFSQTKDRYDKLERAKKFLSEEEIINVYREAIQKRPELFDRIPSEYRKKLTPQSSSSSMTGVLKSQKDKVIKFPHTMISMPQQIQEQLAERFSQELIPVFSNLINRFGGNFDSYWRTVPVPIRNILPADIRNKVIQYYQIWIDKNPGFITKVPEDIKPLIRTASMNWYRLILKRAQQDECKGWMAVRMDRSMSKKIQDWGKKYITDDIVYDKDDHGREEDTHITLMYGICSDDPDIIKKIVEDEKPIKATLGKVGFFKPSDDYDVVVIKVDSPDLERINNKIKSILNIKSTFDEYKPHCTVSYIKKGTGMRFAGDTFFDGTKLVFNKIVFKNNKKEETEISLK